MAISVLLPVRNGAETLSVALESLRRQTLAPTECIVIDDGSTDSTPALLKRSKIRGLRVLRSPGVGIARALNLGLDACRWEWIARMDADDRCHPARLERQMGLTRSDPELSLIGCRVRHVVEHASASSVNVRADCAGMRRHVEWANTHLTHMEMERAVWLDSPLPHPTWLVGRRAFEAIGHYATTDSAGVPIPEDYEWLQRFFSAARRDCRLRAAKVGGEALLDWSDSAQRLTRVSPAYGTEAFDRVKARAARNLLNESRSPRTAPLAFVFGLGPKSKAFLSIFRNEMPGAVHAIVDVHPRRVGMRYRGVEVWGVERWVARMRAERASASSAVNRSFVINCVGTSAARARCESLCASQGLEPISGYISL